MPTTDNRPLKVFLCHAHADRDAVRGLYARLTQDGVNAWLDKAKLLPGQDWELEIRKAVREADVVVVCLSKQFNQRGFRQKEVRLALDTAMEMPEGEIFIIPARLEECDNLESLRRWHWVDLFEEDGYEMLMRALRTRANRIDVTLQAEQIWLSNVTAPYKSESPSSRKQDTPKANQSKPEKIQAKKGLSTGKPNTAIVVALIGLFVTICVTLISSPFIGKMFSIAPETTVVMSIPTKTLVPSTNTPAPLTDTPILPTNTPIPPTNIPVPQTFTPTPGIGSFIESDGVMMLYIPAGTFLMGAEKYEDEKPIHSVVLDAYYMDKFEVTNAAYKRCVDLGACNPPTKSKSSTHAAYYNNPEFDEYPVIYVDWNMAKTYCEWHGDRLPTEAEWEKAARGTDGRTFPWGESISCNKANYNYKCVGDTTKVGSYLDGVSPYGLYDMAGNVWEWVNDWYDENYYQNSPLENPLGPTIGQDHVFRGGSWYHFVDFERSAFRDINAPSYISGDVIGFRCARSLP